MTGLVDLSHPIEDGMVTYPGLPGPRITDHLSREASRSHYAEGTQFHIGRIDMVANTGTYLDTPFHRYPDGYDLAGLDLGRVADVAGVCLATSERIVAAAILDEVDIADRAVLFATGWSRHWRTDHYGDASHPCLAEETAARLVAGGAALVGIDSVNIDDTTGRHRPVHSRLLAAGIPIVEHLTGLDELIGVPFRFFAVPVKVRAFGTFPVRAFAIVEK